jgi:hypothetical protein
LSKTEDADKSEKVDGEREKKKRFYGKKKKKKDRREGEEDKGERTGRKIK